MTDLISFHAVISGHVQGVFFRAFVAERALELGLRGYVRNSSGNEVEVQAEGDKEHLEKLLQHLKIGPPAARVAKMAVNWGVFTGRYARFEVKR